MAGLAGAALDTNQTYTGFDIRGLSHLNKKPRLLVGSKKDPDKGIIMALALKPRGDVTKSPKQGYQRPHKRT